MAYTLTRDSDDAAADFVTLDPDDPNIASPVVELINTPLVAGSAARIAPDKGVPYRWRGFRNFKNIISAHNSIQALRTGLKGKLVTVDYDGQAFDRLLVLDVRERLARSIVLGVGGLSVTTGGLWGEAIGSSTTPAIAVIEIIVLHVGPEAA